MTQTPSGLHGGFSSTNIYYRLSGKYKLFSNTSLKQNTSWNHQHRQLITNPNATVSWFQIQMQCWMHCGFDIRCWWCWSSPQHRRPPSYEVGQCGRGSEWTQIGGVTWWCWWPYDFGDGFGDLVILVMILVTWWWWWLWWPGDFGDDFGHLMMLIIFMVTFTLLISQWWSRWCN